MKHYKKFWDWLASNSSKIESLINNGESSSATELISNQLDFINHNISWEIGIKNGEVELVISAQGDKSLGEILDGMFMDCPNIPKWKIYRYKQPKSLSSLSKIIVSQGYNINLEKITTHVSLNPLKNKIDIILISPEFNQIPDKQIYNLAFFILDGILGEKIVEEWVGKIDINVIEEKNANLLLSNLHKFISELIEAS